MGDIEDIHWKYIFGKKKKKKISIQRDWPS